MSYRLPPTVVPSRYEIRLEPDLDGARFAGEEVVTVTVREPVIEIVLNAAELEIASVAAEGPGGAVIPGRARAADGVAPGDPARGRVPRRRLPDGYR